LGRCFVGEGVLVPVVDDGYVLPVVVAPCSEGVIVRVENGGNHLDQLRVQCAIARVASRIVDRLGCKVVRATLSRKVMRVYGLPLP